MTGRRHFLLSLAVGAAGLAGGCGGRAAASPTSVTRRARALGTEMEITALHADPARAAAAIEAAFAEIDLIENVMSLYRPASQLCRLNREGRLDEPHPHLVTVLRAAQSFSERSGGRFDVTIQPLWRLYAERAKGVEWAVPTFRQDGSQDRLNHARRSKEGGHSPPYGEPTEDEIHRARALVDYRQLDVSDRRICFLRPGMAATLNGIAQGFAADRASTVLRERGIEQALINAGELASIGRKPDGRPWRVGIQHPREREAYIALAALAGRCLATSGDYETTFGSFDRHHLLDPTTGRPANRFASVSVLAPTGLAADGLSTALFILGPDQGAELLRQTPGTDLLLVRKDGSVQATPGFPLVSEGEAA